MTMRFSTRAATIAFFISLLVGLAASQSWKLLDSPFVAFIFPTLGLFSAIEHCHPLPFFPGMIAFFHSSSVVWAAVAGIAWPLLQRQSSRIDSASTTSTAKTHRVLGWLAVGHALLVLAGVPFAPADLTSWPHQAWIALAYLWLLWPLVLLIHRGRSLFRVMAPLVVAAPLFCYELPPAPKLGDVFPMSAIGLVRFSSAFRSGCAQARYDVRVEPLFLEGFGFGGGYTPRAPSFSDPLGRACKVEVNPVAGCVVNESIEGHASGYNMIVMQEIERRFGRDIIEEALALNERDRYLSTEFQTANPAAEKVDYDTEERGTDSAYVHFCYYFPGSVQQLEQVWLYKKQPDYSWRVVAKEGPKPAGSEFGDH